MIGGTPVMTALASRSTTGMSTGRTCSTGTVDGVDPISSDTVVQAYINKIRSAGGDIVPSVGGYGGTKLGQARRLEVVVQLGSGSRSQPVPVQPL